MTADEYIVQELLQIKQELRELKEELEITNIANKGMQDKYNELKQQTEKYCNLLNELKSYCVLSKPGSNLTSIKIIYDTEDYSARRNIAFSDERIYQILTELLGPIMEEYDE